MMTITDLQKVATQQVPHGVFAESLQGRGGGDGGKVLQRGVQEWGSRSRCRCGDQQWDLGFGPGVISRILARIGIQKWGPGFLEEDSRKRTQEQRPGAGGSKRYRRHRSLIHGSSRVALLLGRRVLTRPDFCLQYLCQMPDEQKPSEKV